MEMVRIDRSKWLFGHLNPHHVYVSSGGNACALGHYDFQCGAFLTLESIPWRSSVIRINDARRMSRKRRESRIKAAFKRGGVECRFVGRYPK